MHEHDSGLSSHIKCIIKDAELETAHPFCSDPEAQTCKNNYLQRLNWPRRYSKTVPMKRDCVTLTLSRLLMLLDLHKHQYISMECTLICLEERKLTDMRQIAKSDDFGQA